MRLPADVQLAIYNEALRLVGERALSSLSENREPRRLLDAAWNFNAIDTALEQGQWKWALRPASLTYSPSVQPSFGFRYAFNQPEDMLRLSYFCEDERFRFPLLQYMDAGGYWFCDLDTIYIQYVSNDAAYGGDLSKWTNSFCKYFSACLAVEIAPRLTQAENRVQVLSKLMMERLLHAKSLDAMADPSKELPMASWEQSRYGSQTGRNGGWC